jgi:hypothetical protein
VHSFLGIIAFTELHIFPQEEKQRKLLRVRLDMAKFLQETLRESGLKANAHIVGTDTFKEFFRKVRGSGNYVIPCRTNHGLSLGPFHWRIALGAGRHQRRKAIRR